MAIDKDNQAQGYSPQLCQQRQDFCDRRITTLEVTVKDDAAKQETRLIKLYDRLDEVATAAQTRYEQAMQEAQKRQPAWVTIVIGLLSASCAGLAVAAIR